MSAADKLRAMRDEWTTPQLHFTAAQADALIALCEVLEVAQPRGLEAWCELCFRQGHDDGCAYAAFLATLEKP